MEQDPDALDDFGSNAISSSADQFQNQVQGPGYGQAHTQGLGQGYDQGQVHGKSQFQGGAKKLEVSFSHK